jgi:hypothetical protein
MTKSVNDTWDLGAVNSQTLAGCCCSDFIRARAECAAKRHDLGQVGHPMRGA